MAFMVYIVFFVCVLTPLVAMFVVYGYIYSVVRRHFARIAAMMPPQAVSMSVVQSQDPAVSQSSSSSSRRGTEPESSNNSESTVPTTREGITLSALTKVISRGLMNTPCKFHQDCSKPFIRYRGNKMCSDERTNERGGRIARKI